MAVVDKPRFFVRMTLSKKTQEKIFPALSNIGIYETYGVPFILTLPYHIFGKLICEINMMDDPPTLKQLCIEVIDYTKEPVRKMMKYERIVFDG